MKSSIRLLNIGTPFQQGFNAAKNGIHKNPYPEKTYNNANWFFGYCIFFDGEDKNILLHYCECGSIKNITQRSDD